MARAIITVGTSFREALCWNIDNVWRGDYNIPAHLGPGSIEVKKLHLKMAENTRSWNSEKQFINVFQSIPDNKTWRYPAEIDTLLTLERIEKNEFQSINEIVFIYSQGDGQLAKSVLVELIKQIWPSRNFTVIPTNPYPNLPNTSGLQIDNIFDIITNLIETNMGNVDTAFLLLTGGYKIVTICGKQVFDDLDDRSYWLIYKHEDGATLVHKKNPPETYIYF